MRSTFTQTTQEKPAPAQQPGQGYLYSTVYELLADRIASGVVPQGAILKESSISTQLGISRAPVRRALAMLAKEGLIAEAQGQGFQVGDASPVMLSSKTLHEILVGDSTGMDRQVSWERIYSDVQEQILASLPFGHYRILESELGELYGMSRTVAREVLWRLTDGRLIEKDRKSHWIVSQLSARSIRDTFEMRQILEPRALEQVAKTLNRKWLEDLSDRVEAAISAFSSCTADALNELDHHIFNVMFEQLRNRRMLDAVRRNQVSLVIHRLFRHHFPLRDDLSSLHDYDQILHHLLSGTTEVACMLLGSHLRQNESIALARLRVLSVLPPPQAAPYLVPIHREGLSDA